MPFVTPAFSKNQVNKAGAILAAPETYSEEDRQWAATVLANWRACHGYPINTFQATLRTRLKNGYGPSIVAQRLKRAPSIISKLQRFGGMQLARMQDIGGLRAVLGSLRGVRRLERTYRDPALLAHPLTNSKDYIDEPKEDGYRSVHLIYRYKNERAPTYDGLSLELQLRTKRQHAWATAVETMGTFLGQALKSGQGDQAWRDFFAKASAALAIIEGTAPVPGFEGRDRDPVFKDVADTEKRLKVLDKLKGFAIATDRITAAGRRGAYHLIVLDSRERTVEITPYPIGSLEQANLAYAAVEERTRGGEAIEAVLVAAGPITALRAAYPNYFLDTRAFVSEMEAVIAEASQQRAKGWPNRKAKRR